MNIHQYFLMLCFVVGFSARLTMGLAGFEFELLMSKMDYLQDKLQEVEYSVKSSIEKMERRVEHNFVKLEKDGKERYKQVYDSMKERDTTHENKLLKLETSMEATEGTLHGAIQHLAHSVKTTERNSLTHLRELESKLINKINSVERNQVTLNNSCHESSQIELKLVGNKDTIDKLTNSVTNVTSLMETSNAILAAQHIHPVRSCRLDTKVSGKHIFRLWENSNPFQVLCEQTKFGGGWTVIQFRCNGAVDFYRSWSEYRNGFGYLDSEFWLGLENIYQLTKNRSHELIVEVQDFFGNYGYARYGEFEIGCESEMYMLKKIEYHSGIAGDSMSYNKGKHFSTFDRNNGNNCAKDRHGAWWYDACTHTNLNGRYKNTQNDQSGISWFHLRGDYREIAITRMMIRDITN